MVKAFFIKYNFILPEGTEHSSYTYQKLFRAIYGYTQNVTKSNGKTYRYHRKGVLSTIPFVKAGKNSVIIPQKSLSSLDTFFKTGKNPAHFWRVKGDWKATFYMDEKEISDEQVAAALKDLIERSFSEDSDDALIPGLELAAQKAASGTPLAPEKVKAALVEAEKIVALPWFREVYSKDAQLRKFSENYKSLKGQ